MKIQEINSIDWIVEHQKLVESFQRFEYLTAIHLGAEEFQVITKVSYVDLSDSVLTITKTFGEINSLLTIYPNCEFFERETWQMFGLKFIGHDKIQNAFAVDFAGHPMRRDFGLAPRQERPWPGAVEPDAKSRRRPSLPPGVLESWKTNAT